MNKHGGVRRQRQVQLNQENNNSRYHAQSLNNNNSNNNNNNDNNDNVNIDNYINQFNNNSPLEGAPIGKATGQSSYRPKPGQSTKNMGRAMTTTAQKQQEPTRQYHRKQLTAKEQKNQNKRRKNHDIKIKQKKVETKLERNLEKEKILLHAKSFVQDDGRLIIKSNERTSIREQIEIYNNAVLTLESINKKFKQLTKSQITRLVNRLETLYDYERELEAFSTYLLRTEILHGYTRGYMKRFLQKQNKDIIAHLNKTFMKANDIVILFVSQLRNKSK
jgi:hypothetical protein